MTLGNPAMLLGPPGEVREGDSTALPGELPAYGCSVHMPNPTPGSRGVGGGNMPCQRPVGQNVNVG